MKSKMCPEALLGKGDKRIRGHSKDYYYYFSKVQETYYMGIKVIWVNL